MAIKKKPIKFEELEKMKTFEFLNHNWKRTKLDRACEVEFCRRNFRLHFAYFGDNRKGQVCCSLTQRSKSELYLDLQEVWSSTVNGAVRELETMIYQVIGLTR